MKLFINSLPKSGTNLAQKCVELAGINYSGRSLAASSGIGRFGIVKHMLRWPHANEVPLIVGLEVPVAVSPGWTQAYLHNANGYVTGHAAHSKHINEILNIENYSTIQVIRNPGAVLASWASYIVEPGYYWPKARKFLLNKSFEDRVRFLLYGGTIGSIRQYYRGIKELILNIQGWFDEYNVLVVRYEDLVGSRGGGSDIDQYHTVEKILKHIDRENNGRSIRSITSQLYGGTHTFRKGTIDGWKDKINEGLLEEIITELDELPILKKLGYLW